MKHIFKILTLTLFLIATKSYGQISVCDTIYSNPATMPTYDKGFKSLSNYLMKELVPIISDCIKHGNEIPASLYIVLTIDHNGKVIDAQFSRQDLTATCKDELKEKLLTMRSWTAGQMNGQNVCTKFNWSIGCLKWE